MPRMTAKYSNAISTARTNQITLTDPQNQELVYDQLNQAGYFWNSKIKQWEYHDVAQADPPSPLIKIRVWASIDTVQAQANQIIARCPWQLIVQSKIYPCRPRKQLEGRIYLTALPPSLSSPARASQTPI